MLSYKAAILTTSREDLEMVGQIKPEALTFKLAASDPQSIDALVNIAREGMGRYRKRLIRLGCRTPQLCQSPTYRYRGIARRESDHDDIEPQPTTNGAEKVDKVQSIRPQDSQMNYTLIQTRPELTPRTILDFKPLNDNMVMKNDMHCGSIHINQPPEYIILGDIHGGSLSVVEGSLWVMGDVDNAHIIIKGGKLSIEGHCRNTTIRAFDARISIDGSFQTSRIDQYHGKLEIFGDFKASSASGWQAKMLLWKLSDGYITLNRGNLEIERYNRGTSEARVILCDEVKVTGPSFYPENFDVGTLFERQSDESPNIVKQVARIGQSRGFPD